MTDRRTIDWFEWARALGALAVVALHAMRATELAPGLAAAHPSLFWVEGIVQIPLARWAVPVFFMMSGALILDPGREMPLRKVGRYIWRMAFILLTVGFAFCLMETVAKNPGPTGAYALTPPMVGTAFLHLLQGKSWDHLWYLYALMGLYLLTPVLRPFVRDASRRELGLAVLLAWVLLALVPAANLVLGVRLYRFVTLDASVAYYLAGYYAYNYLELDWRVVAVGLASLALACLPNALSLGSLAGVLSLPQYGVIMPYALLVFLLLRRALDVPIERHPVVRALARDSFGIYLIHPLFGHLAIWFLDCQVLYVPALQAGIFAVGVLGSVVLTRALRLLPGFRDKI